MRALVISGGGNKGAFAGGVAEYLIEHKKRDYDLFLGTSTGSTLVPNLSIGKVQKIKQVFTSVTQSSIFSSSPFRITEQKNGYTSVKMNHINIMKMFINGKKTLGESKNLRRLIRDTFTQKDFYNLQKSGKEVIVTVANLSLNKIEYKNSKDCTYEEFTDWVWISANMVPYMSLEIRNDHEYADGGFGNFIPLKKAIEMGATDIDAIVLRTSEPKINSMHAKNVLDLFLKLFGFMINQIAMDDIDIARMVGKNEKVRINFYFIPNELTDNPLIFNPIRMTRWWKEGFEYAQNVKPIIQDARNRILAFFG